MVTHELKPLSYLGYLDSGYDNVNEALPTRNHPRVIPDELGLGQQREAVPHHVVRPLPRRVLELTAEPPLVGASFGGEESSTWF